MKHEPRPGIHMENPLLTAWVGPKVGWDRASGDLQDRANSVGQDDGVSDMAHPCWLCVSVEGGFRTFLSGRKLAPSSHLNARHLVPPHMPLVPFKLLPWCWSSEGVNLSKSVCGFFKRNCLGLQRFHPPTQLPLVFAARRYGDSSSWHWNPGLGGLVWGWDSSFLRYPS